jgi:hypothetical protein
MSGLTEAMLIEYKKGYKEGIDFALKFIEESKKK